MKIGFSLDAVERKNQEPNRNRVESKYYWDEVFTLVSAAGFHGVEMPYEAGWARRCNGVPLSRVSVQNVFGGVKEFLESLRKKGISKITGVCFNPTILAGGNLDEYISGFEHAAAEALDYAKEAGCEYIVITPTAPIGLLGELCRDEKALLNRTAEVINKLAAMAEDVKVCVKNEYWGLLRGGRIHDFMSMLSKNTYYCVDTANLDIAGVDPAEFIKSCGKRIGCITLTDTSFIDDGEYYKETKPEFPSGKATQVFQDIGQGNIDFPAVISALNGVGFDGWAVVNNRQTRNICRSMLRARYYIDSIMGVQK